MTKLQHTIMIEPPLDEVWDYVMDARNDPVWHSQVIEVGRGADQPTAVGLEIDEVVTFLGRRMPVTHALHRARAEAALGDRRINAAAVPGRGSYDFAPRTAAPVSR